ncbi:MAG: hypothetical protein CMG75_05770 [Candidatus Marinimicrobia bacterium]|nr:hypothetical protein [Candidatus Neomarinimicrobiota bacterium]|tara:strand:- start:1293 stop:1676 length:384 start_codon:yes stop_codon:yes gene_type:complete
MKNEINLFENPGFQKIKENTINDEEVKNKISNSTNKTDSIEKPIDDVELIQGAGSKQNVFLNTKKPKKRLKKKYKFKYSFHELFSFLLASSIIALVIWFFVLRKTVVSTVSEYIPNSLKTYQENSNE